jgi:hypothetical protein
LRAALRGADVIVFLGAAALLWLIVRLAHGVTVPWNGVTALSTVSTAPAELPYYAARSLLRMFAALALSIVFTFSFVYATAAARLRRAEKVLLPLLDILQSVPILGFLRRRPGSQAANWCGCSGCPCGTPRRSSPTPPQTATNDLPGRDRPPSARSGLTDPGENRHACRDWKAFEPLIGHTHSALSRGAGRLRGLKPAQIADLLEEARKEEETELLGRVHEDPELEADVFEELEEDLASRLLGARTNDEIAAVLARMRADDAADTIAELPQRRREPVLDLLPAAQRVKVRTLMGFNPTSAGGLMGLDFLPLDPQITAADALTAVAGATSLQSEALTSVYLLDSEEHLRAWPGWLPWSRPPPRRR